LLHYNKKNKIMYLFFVFLSSFFLFNYHCLFGNPFAPTYWPQEPRLEKEWLTSLDVQQGHITAHKEFSPTGHLAPLSLISPLLGKVKKFSGYDLYIQGYQNFIAGFFVAGSATYQSIRIATRSDRLFLIKWSDLAVQGGWTHSYKNTTELDFVDCTFKAGFYIPDPSIMKNEFGYLFKTNPGAILTGELSFGFFEWLTVGFNCEGIITNQKEYFILAPETIINGNSITFETFVKADHVIKGFSCGFGYTFSHEFERKTVGTTPFSKNTSTQHDIHLMLEYDFTKKQAVLGPRIGFAFHSTVGGKNCLKSSLTQGTLGIEISFNH
jgi:hypothetical protein